MKMWKTFHLNGAIQYLLLFHHSSKEIDIWWSEKEVPFIRETIFKSFEYNVLWHLHSTSGEIIFLDFFFVFGWGSFHFLLFVYYNVGNNGKMTTEIDSSIFCVDRYLEMHCKYQNMDLYRTIEHDTATYVRRKKGYDQWDGICRKYPSTSKIISI